MKTSYFYFILAFLFSGNVLAESLQVFLWEEGGFTTAQNCMAVENKENLSGEIEKWLEAQEVNHLYPLVSEGETPIDLKGSLWQLALENNKPLSVSCPQNSSKPYLVFEVLTQGDSQSTFLFGLSKWDLEVLNSSETINKKTNSIFMPSFLQGIPFLEGELDYLVCTSSSKLNVRNENLDKVIFKAKRFEKVKKFQDWEDKEVKKVINGQEYTFVPVQFPKHNNQIGWVAKDFIQLRSLCPGVPGGGGGSGGDDKWIFPTTKRASVSYKTGQRKFKARRGGGKRSHAACDIYRVKNEKVVSVNNGKIIRSRYYFYQGTYAIEARHSDGRIVRYGEMTGKNVSGVYNGKSIKVGQTIGYIGKVNSGCCTPMLHFELYSGKGKGPLTTGGNKFRRRWDLLDPSGDLTDWEYESFGASF